MGGLNEASEIGQQAAAWGREYAGKRLAILGAGEVGAIILRALRDSGSEVVGVMDDYSVPESRVEGVLVLPTEALVSVCPEGVVLATTKARQRMRDRLRDLGYHGEILALPGDDNDPFCLSAGQLGGAKTLVPGDSTEGAAMSPSHKGRCDSGREQTAGPPAFIVGCGHSGTSLVLAILGAHSRIHAVPEETSLAFHDRQTASEMMRQFDAQAIAGGRCRWVEKTPSHIRRIGAILDMCPDARILLIVRDGRDVACSIQDRTGSLERGIRRWVVDNEAGKRYWGHPNVHVFRYESLITGFEDTVRQILRFLGEEYEEGMRQYNKNPIKFYSDKIEKPPSEAGKFHDQYRNWQINQPLFDGRGKWKRMTGEELSLVYSIGGDMLTELGYWDGGLVDGGLVDGGCRRESSLQ